MNDQSALFDATPAPMRPWQRSTRLDPARTDGIERVSRNTPEDWAERFDAEVERRAGIGDEFSVYEVLEVVGKPEDVHPSAIGARMRVASTRGIVRKVGHARRVSHGDDVVLWAGVA